MSYDISYVDSLTKEPIQVSPYSSQGGTFQIEKTIINNEEVWSPSLITDCEINITYNYSVFYYKYLDSELGIRWLYGKSGDVVKSALIKTIISLSNEIDFKQTQFSENEDNLINAINRISSIIPSKHYVISIDTILGDNIPKTDLQTYFNKIKNTDLSLLPEEEINLLLKNKLIEESSYYWKSTADNAAKPLITMLYWIYQNPNGVFNGD